MRKMTSSSIPGSGATRNAVLETIASECQAQPLTSHPPQPEDQVQGKDDAIAAASIAWGYLEGCHSESLSTSLTDS